MKQRDSRTPDEVQHQKDIARYEYGRRDTQALLKQVLGMEGSTKQDDSFRLRHTFTFWPEKRQARVMRAVHEGADFLEAIRAEEREGG